MSAVARFATAAILAALLHSCAGTPPPVDQRTPGADVRRTVANRLAAVLVTNGHQHDPIRQQHPPAQPPDDADGGSATPVSHDGYFLTANHVLSREEGRNVFVIHPGNGSWIRSQARIVWRSPSADLALLHVPAATPDHYRWTPSDRWLPLGMSIIHGGLATGMRSGHGRLASPLGPERGTRAHRRFKIDLPLLPGDSGGPVVDADGALVGINSSVEFIVPMETMIFIDSECIRPNVRRLEALIQADRKRRASHRRSSP
jgi:S1-C subfamily serine protease